ncbi:DUF1450 domain-containing protein [Bacillus sp. FJAT-45350]|uniref:DUF1450 domain-containing protein n=1 Tax=Bacillus sp. FJAT-45350 TaxID=2011014 RepID=UPI000BB84048
MSKVCLCKENFKTKKVAKALESFNPSIKVKRKGCLGECKTCKKCPFYILNGKITKCNSIEDLYGQLKKI